MGLHGGTDGTSSLRSAENIKPLASRPLNKALQKVLVFRFVNPGPGGSGGADPTVEGLPPSEPPAGGLEGALGGGRPPGIRHLHLQQLLLLEQQTAVARTGAVVEAVPADAAAAAATKTNSISPPAVGPVSFLL